MEPLDLTAQSNGSVIFLGDRKAREYDETEDAEMSFLLDIQELMHDKNSLTPPPPEEK